MGVGVLLLATGVLAAPSAPPDKKPLAPDGRTIVVEITGDIDLGLGSFLERQLDDAKAGDLVVLRVNTFGGRIDAAVAMRDALLGCKAKTVAFIDKRAISAGALISLATDEIVMTRGATIGAATPIELKGGEMAPVEAKVVSYFRKEMKATAEAKGRRGDLAEAMVDASVVVADANDNDSSTLTLTTEEALRLKVAAFSAESIDELLPHYGRHIEAAAVFRPQINWAERVARFLSEPSISSLLMTLGMIGILIELWAPGHAVAGAFGVLCLLLFFFGHYVVHLAGWEEILLFLVGAAMIGFEVIFWSGHGALAVLGVILVVASLALALVDVKHVPLSVSWSLGWVSSALVRVFGSILLTGVAMALVTRFLPSTRFGKRLVLSQAIAGDAGSASMQMSSVLGDVAGGAARLVGQRGTTETALRPSGKALVAGRHLDVVSDGGFIEPGVDVVVVSVTSGNIVVKVVA